MCWRGVSGQGVDDYRKASSKLPLKVTANTGNVALRVPNAKIPLSVVQAAQIPITATSAKSEW